MVRDDGTWLDVTAPKQRAVLSFLALEAGRAVDTAELIDAVWGDDPPRSVVKALQTYVSALRSVLTPAVIETEAGRYRLLISPDDVDVYRFEWLLGDASRAADEGSFQKAVLCLDVALSLWRARPIDRRPGDGGGGAAVERAALESVDAGLVPLGSVDALRAYERVRKILAEQLGVDPSPGLRALEAAILNHSPELAPPAPRRCRHLNSLVVSRSSLTTSRPLRSRRRRAPPHPKWGPRPPQPRTARFTLLMTRPWS